MPRTPLSGGCIYTDSYFRVDGEATFKRCEVGGHGESAPGPGGALYVGDTGSVLFYGALEMSDVIILNDDGNKGGGIYSKWNVNIRGDAVFSDLWAEEGGAIYNGVSDQFNFRNKATAVFKDCLAFDGVGGALYNRRYFQVFRPCFVCEY